MTFSIKCPNCGSAVGSGSFSSKDQETSTLYLSVQAEASPPHEQVASQPQPAPTQEQP